MNKILKVIVDFLDGRPYYRATRNLPEHKLRIEVSYRRDQLAAQIMAGILSSHQLILPEDKEKLANVSYEYADALIERGRRG